jgi:hypothetical protein
MHRGFRRRRLAKYISRANAAVIDLRELLWHG